MYFPVSKGPNFPVSLYFETDQWPNMTIGEPDLTPGIWPMGHHLRFNEDPRVPDVGCLSYTFYLLFTYFLVYYIYCVCMKGKRQMLS